MGKPAGALLRVTGTTRKDGTGAVTRQEALHMLGLAEGASREDIAAAHRELAQMLHPDKYGDSPRLQKRAEAQMRSINEARDVLLGSRAEKSSWPGPASASSANAQAFRSRARAQAAETARLVVVQNMRTLSGTRRNARIMLVVGLIGLIVSVRLRGTPRTLGFSICMWLAVWGAVDMIRASKELSFLRQREKELARERKEAEKAAG